jgi:hypothetical protein
MKPPQPMDTAGEASVYDEFTGDHPQVQITDQMCFSANFANFLKLVILDPRTSFIKEII